MATTVARPAGSWISFPIRNPLPAVPPDLCSVPPEILVPAANETLELALGSRVALNCTVRWAAAERCEPVPAWTKDGQWLGSESSQNTAWFAQNASEQLLASVLRLNLTHDADFGVFACWVSNATATFTLRRVGRDTPGTEKGRLQGGRACIGQERQPHGAHGCLSRGSVSWHKPTPNPENLGQEPPATLTVPFPVLAEAAGHVPAVLAALLVLALLVLLAGLYVRCRLSVLLWYRNRYGELEINDGKLYDAYVSHTTSPDDRKFVHFIVKPQLENRYGYKLFLDEQTILPNSEPSADLIMNVSRCRRLIVVLSVAYLEQDWCNGSFREGLWRLLELSKKPIFIVFESQYREITHPAISLLKQHRSAVTLLVWRAGSMGCSLCFGAPKKQVGALVFQRPFKENQQKQPQIGALAPQARAIRSPVPLGGLPQPRRQREASAPGVKLWPVAAVAISGPGREPEPSGAFQQTPSSDFWKELCLALPRKVSFQGTVGDPQTQLQEDKDPMLILHSSYLDGSGDLHPDGDLGTGLRGCVFRSPPPPRIGGLGAPVASAAGATEDAQLRDGQRQELDVSDLGSRNYGARTDFYCLVTEDDI
ncbi:hypothetical protein QYF61_013542 [Mycteria americana]|uniref:Single Ig IL-1-related receptor n=1 Tax=Mycteria americana TaxID=33587 RepID=A0AAN7P5B6_MYCAM|nr:hypothetical protein QYF61_013542 [Mycteria americana]